MVKLIAQTAFGDGLPRAVGGVTLTEVSMPGMWSVAPLKGQQKAVSKALGISLPRPNRTTSGAGTQALWAGPGMAYVRASALPDLSGLAAVTDQSDAWAVLTIAGSTVTDVLARLVPIDLRAQTFKTGHTARTLVGHMPASVTRTGPQSIEIMVMRSMARTLVHELDRATRLFAGR